MKLRFFRWLSIFLLLAGRLPAQNSAGEKAAVAPVAASKGQVVVVPLKGEINAAQLEAFQRALAEAEANEASAVIVEIDSEGGEVNAILGEIDALLAVKVPTAAWVNGKAVSGAALVTLATDKIFLHTSASIGAPTITGPFGSQKWPEKATATIVAKAREAARAKGHPEDVAEAFIRMETEVKRGEKVLDGPTTLLSLNATAASTSHYGHPLLAAGIADNAAAVVQLAGFAGAIKGSNVEAVGAVPAKNLPVVGGNTGPIFVIPLEGEVNETQFVFLRRALKEAQRARASAVIVEINTFGGRVDSAMEEMDALLATSVPTYAFVNPKAISAGSLISLATKKIYMHPNAVIGVSAVVGGGGEDLDKTSGEKATSMVVAKARGAANANGHPEDVAEAFVRIESEVTRGGKTLDGKTTIFALNAVDAVKMYDGKPLLATGLASTVEDLIRAEGLTGPIQRFQPSGFEWLASWITSIAPLLLIGGLIGGYIEFKAPGFGIPGICSLICFALFFGGHFIAGLAGMEAVVVFVIGLALVITEIFLFPGLIIPGLIGTLMMLGSLVWAMVDHWPTESGEWRFPTGKELEAPMLNLILALAGAGVGMALLAKYLPKTSFYRRLVLADAVPGGVGVTVPEVNVAIAVGDTGTAATPLRPAGKALIAGETHDVVSVGDFIAAGASVRVISADGMRVVVEPA